MSILSNLTNLLTEDIRATIISLMIGIIVYKLARFYADVFSLPPGPIPLPFLGNILYFRGTKEHWTVELEKVGEKYGPVFTMWIGNFPVVYISDIDIARETFRKNDFAGRPKSVFGSVIKSDDHLQDIITADYGHHWQALRRVAHSAVQKYSNTDKLVYLVSDCVEHTIKTIIEKEGLNKPFIPYDYIYSMFLNILAASAFGVRDFFNETNQRFLFWEMFPLLRKFDYKVFNRMRILFAKNFELLSNKFKSHYKDYDESVVRDFCDTLISGKNDALKEGKESTPYLTDGNLTYVLFDLFIAATDTSQTTFKWIVFLMTYYPEVLQKLRQEIVNEIGDRIPTHEDKNRCHYTQAVIFETLRHRNVSATGVHHKAVVTSKIGGYTIPEGTQVTVLQGHILHKEEYWENAKEFRPERFLENGNLIMTRLKAFIPFGIGRRVCLGKKLALADLFLVLVRFIQKTIDYDILLHNTGDTEFDPDRAVEFHPKDFEISFKTK